MSIVSVEKVSKFYGKKKVLDNVSFTIQRGEIFGLLGSNGAGKSTLTSIILGIEKATSGSVSLFDSTDVNISKPRFALVPQEDAFYRDFSVEKNLLFFGSIYGLSGEVLKNRVKFLLAWLYLEDYKNIRADFLSGGFQKLLNIAISLLHDPELIFLDEPTVGLDPKMRQLFWDKILELKNNGKTIILTTHYMEEAEQLCDDIVIMDQGIILKEGTVNELLGVGPGYEQVMITIPLKRTLDDLFTELTGRHLHE
ncbi:MAG: ABC transporter ATP-binding protein [Candidatus Diapherotrites archaeon]|nr:ABC transporter ATP-binding protein [Candidatus Diapherotrites archaeon]